jgi:hypothetical protein
MKSIAVRGINTARSPASSAITLQDVTITAERDFHIRNAEKPVFKRVTRTIKAGVAPARIPGEH